MSRASELIAQIEGVNTNQPKSRASELISQIEQSNTSRKPGFTGTWEEPGAQKFFKKPSLAKTAANLLAPAPTSIYETLVTGNPKPASELARTGLETFGGTFGGAPGYVVGKRAADVVDVHGLGIPKEQLPKTLFADYALKQYADIGNKYFPDNVVSKLLSTQPKRGTVGGEVNQVVRDLMDAYTFEGVGQTLKSGIEDVVFPVSKKVGSFIGTHIPWKTKHRIKEMAAKELEPMVRNIETTPEYGKLYEESREFEKKIPGVKYTLGQSSGEPSAIMAERRFSRGEPGGSPEKFELQKLRNQLAGEEYVGKTIPPIGEDVEEVIKVAKTKQGILKDRLKGASEEASEIYVKNRPAGEASKMHYNKGQQIFENIEKSRGGAYKVASEKFNKIPNLILNSDEMLDDMIQLEDSFKVAGYKPAAFPKGAYDNLLNRISTVDERGNRLARQIPFQELRGVRSSLKADIRKMRSMVGREDADVFGHYAGQLEGITDKGLKQVSEINPEAAKSYKEAVDYYRDVYSPSFKQRTVRDVLTRGVGGAETKYDYSAIPNKFTKNIDTAKDYTRVFGQGDKDIQEVMMTEMLNASKTDAGINLKNARTWYGHNHGVLGELGISKPFKEIIKTQQSLESAARNVDNFNKSILSKVLDADPQFAIEKAFGGNTKNTAATMRSLLQSLPPENTPVGDSSRKGLQRAFVDFLFNKSEKELQSEISREVGRSPIVNVAKRSSLLNQYDGALKELYKNDPKKYKALHYYQKNYEILQRNLRSPFGGGSDTKELMSKDVGRISGIALQGFGAKIKIMRILSRYYSAGLETKVNAIIEKGLLDPDVAFDLVRGIKQPDLLPRVIDKHLFNMQNYGVAGRLVPKKEESRQRKEKQLQE